MTWTATVCRTFRPPRTCISAWCRPTWVWSGFFAVNGALALATALWASDAVWALYNGFVAYVLVGVLFAGEWLVRRSVRAAHG